MGLFGSIGKALGSVGKAIGKVAKTVFPPVLSVVKAVVPGGGLVGAAVDVASSAIGGNGSSLTKEIKEQATRAFESGRDSITYSTESVRSGRTLKKVIIWR